MNAEGDSRFAFCVYRVSAVYLASAFGCGVAALRCIADFQSAERCWAKRRLAGWKPAIRQIGNLRYSFAVPNSFHIPHIKAGIASAGVPRT